MNESLMKRLNGKAEEQLVSSVPGSVSGAFTFHNYLPCIINHVAEFPVAKEAGKTVESIKACAGEKRHAAFCVNSRRMIYKAASTCCISSDKFQELKRH